MNQRDYSKQFQAMVLDPEAWRGSARALIEATAMLEPKIDEFWRGVKLRRSWNDGGVAVYFMLCSFALENLLKARLIERRQPELEAALASGSNLPKMLKEHDLYRLTCEAGLNALAAEEESLLHRLTRSAVWYGRYPVPVAAPGLDTFRKSPHKDFQISLTQYTSADRDDIKRLFRKLG
jgi:hypothetical protein